MTTSNNSRNSQPVGQDAGTIITVPSYMRKHIHLHEFKRDGLVQLNDYSPFYHNPTIPNVGHMARVHKLYAKSPVSKSNNEPTCELCKRTLRAAGQTDAKLGAKGIASYTLLLFNHNKRELFVCAACAAGSNFRRDVLKAIPSDWHDTVATDGRDVYGLVSTLFAMDAITAADGTRPYRIHNISSKPDISVCAKVNGSFVPQTFDWPVVTTNVRNESVIAQQAAADEREKAAAARKAARKAELDKARKAAAAAKQANKQASKPTTASKSTGKVTATSKPKAS